MTLDHEPDPCVGDWLVGRLGSQGARIGSLVPSGFEAYARVLHPGVGRWPGEPPPVGTLGGASLRGVVEAIAGHDGTDAEVVAALWDGYGWIGGGGVSMLWARDGEWTPDERAAAEQHAAEREATLARGPFAPDVLAAPRLELPGRSYLLFRGTIADVPAVLDPDGPWSTPGFGSWGQTPNLLWPVDRSWCLATEIDLDSTVIGGPARLIEAVLAHPALEALPLPPDASLTFDAGAAN
ncbi:hypothetical protein OEB99_04690 [Actinotalea sp. M2MS4P-6]|uniref:hypothetical protein n=1 Tax=Actinotalea sp. M2MS4P-6 TaxID=2983762 RepID=UPI0021E3E133|nr:hypothetical protein [Actinotalea sp. M2MS4P-6]MCV2393598.1 hypothetical protein [Actinotalea sp. M2MS4P-6]